MRNFEYIALLGARNSAVLDRQSQVDAGQGFSSPLEVHLYQKFQLYLVPEIENYSLTYLEKEKLYYESGRMAF